MKKNTRIKAAVKKKSRKNSKYDSAWKKIIETFFKDFLEFFYPEIYRAIDFTKEIQFLDKELQDIDPESKLGDREADVLVKVHLKDGSQSYICIIIHIEVQNQPKPGLMHRMFIYFYRAYDKLVDKKLPMISVAILADDSPGYRPDEFLINLYGFELKMKIPIVKILDYKLKEEMREKLEVSKNPMAMIVKAQLKSHEVKGAGNAIKFEATKELIRQCYKSGYTREATRGIMKFLALVIRLPESFKNRVNKVVKKVEEEYKMEYVPFWERDARKEGLNEGVTIGRKEGLNEGVTIGIKEGIKEEKIATAKKLLEMGIDIDKISRATGLDKSEIEKLSPTSH